MRVERIVVLLLLIAGCGSQTAPKAAPSSSLGDAPVAKVTPNDGRCLGALVTRRPPSGWSEAGAILVTLEDGRPTKFEARDREGKAIESTAAPKQKKEARQWIESATCRLGGRIVIADKEAKEGTATFVVMKPDVEDERRDLATLCDAPEPSDPRLAPGLDTSQQMRIAVEVFEERLTTTKWRAWLRDMMDELDERPAHARAPVRRTKADELHDLASKVGLTKCWFEDGLRR